jgi:hypothetical protein
MSRAALADLFVRSGGNRKMRRTVAAIGIMPAEINAARERLQAVQL